MVLPVHHIRAGDMSKVTLFSLQITGCNVIEVIPPLPIKSKIGIGNVRAFVLADQVVNGAGWIVEGMSGRLGPKKPGKGKDQADNKKDGNWFFVDYESRADKKVFFVDYESRADLKIFFVDYESRAGWKNSGKKHILY